MNDPMERVIVADGMCYPQMRIIHQKSIPPENVRVSVDRVVEQYKDVPVPVPTEWIKKLHQAHGTFIQWPKEMVDLSTNEETTPKDKCAIRNKVVDSAKNKNVESGHDTKGSSTKPKKAFVYDNEFQHLSQKCKSMHSSLSVFVERQIISMPFDKNIFLYDTDNIPITREDVMELLKGACLNVPILQIFIMALCDENADNLSFQNSFGFMCPNRISACMQTNKINDSLSYMTKAMQEHSSKRFIFCPYHEGNHWLLLVLCNSTSEVYVFDSKQPSPTKKRSLMIRLTLSNAFRIYKSLGAGSTLTWNDADCAQQKASTECGYYVMRYILEIVNSSRSSEKLTKVLKRSTPYSVDEINVVRDIWATYFITNAPI